MNRRIMRCLCALCVGALLSCESAMIKSRDKEELNSFFQRLRANIGLEM